MKIHMSFNKTLYYKMQLAFAQKANRFIYTIRRIKPLRSQISEEWYVRTDVKRVLGILGMIGAFLGDVFGKIFYFVLVIVLPNLIMQGTFLEVDARTFGKMLLWSFFFMNCMIGSFANSHITKVGSVDEDEYLILNLMRFNPREHYLTGILWEYGKQFLYYTVIILIVTGGILKEKGLPVAWVMGMYVCFRFIGEAARLRLNDHYGIPFQKRNKVVAGYFYFYHFIMFLLAYGTYPLLYFWGGGKHKVAIPILENGWVLALLLAAAVVAMLFSVRYLWGYQDYILIARRLCNLHEFTEKKEAAATVQKASYSLQDKEVDEKELQSHMYQNKKGYDYLNAIFFQRHKRLVRNVVMMKTGIAGVVFGVAAVALVIAQVVMPAGDYMDLSRVIWKSVGQFIPIIVFIMYCASSGQNLTRAMFYNCDISLLKYGYYRTPEAILQGFGIRLKYMIRAELPTVSVFTAGVVVNTLLLRQQEHWMQMLSIVVCVCILSVFYSVVFLCMYYIFQPFTEGGAVTGMGYKVCTVVMYWMAYMCLQIRTVPAYFSALVLGITIVVLIAAFIIAWRVAPKTFHLK